jgi:hypothetical protein
MRPDQTGHPDIGLIQEKWIGRVVVEWSRLEACLHDMIWACAGVSMEDGRVLTARQDVTRLIAMLHVLLPRNLDGDALNKTLDAIEDANRLRDDRNYIAHGTWGTLMPEGHKISASLRAASKPGEVTSEHFPVERMRQIVNDIIKTRNALLPALYALNPSLDPSNDRSKPPVPDEPDSSPKHREAQIREQP